MEVTGVDTTGSATGKVQRDLARLREVSGQIIGRMFFGTMLRSMRDSGLSTGIGRGGRGEAVFAEQLHGLYAERIGAAKGGGFKDILFNALSAQQERISTALAENGRATV